MDWLLIGIGSKPARIVWEAADESGSESSDSGPGSPSAEQVEQRDRFMDELAHFEGGDSAIFDRYKERHGK
jgi:hypothetical protein